MSDEEVIRAAMRLLGQRTSERKRESSRANAKRPRKRRKLTVSKTNAISESNDKIAENKVSTFS